LEFVQHRFSKILIKISKPEPTTILRQTGPDPLIWASLGKVTLNPWPQKFTIISSKHLLKLKRRRRLD